MYNPLNNEIIIPAGVLQAPLFDAEADPASNFGAIFAHAAAAYPTPKTRPGTHTEKP